MISFCHFWFSQSTTEEWQNQSMKGIKPQILVFQILPSSQIFFKNFTNGKKFYFPNCSLVVRLIILMEHVLFRTLFLSEELQFYVYFVGPRLHWFLSTIHLNQNKFCRVWVWILYLDFETKHLRQFWCKTLKQHKRKRQ